MNYALIENDIVSNIIFMLPHSAAGFNNAVAIGDIPVSIGDLYYYGDFYRDGVKLISNIDQLEAEYSDEIAALVEMVYQDDMGVIEG